MTVIFFLGEEFYTDYGGEFRGEYSVINTLAMMIAPNSRARKGGREGGKYGGVWGEESRIADCEGMVQPSQQHV